MFKEILAQLYHWQIKLFEKLHYYQNKLHKMVVLMVLFCTLPLNFYAFETWDGTSTSSWTKGTGTSTNPYLIETAAQLAYLSQQVNAGTNYSGIFFQLENDIDLNNQEWTPIGTENNPFKGFFSGNHHIIYNMQITGTFAFNGLFGYVNQGIINKVGIENCNIDIPNYTNRGMLGVGAIAGYYSSPNLPIVYCYASGRIRVYNTDGTECYLYNQTFVTGGIVGFLVFSSLDYCYSDVDISYGTHRDAGGLVGRAYSSSVNPVCTIQNSYNKGNVRAMNCRAGIVGWTYGNTRTEIRNCYNTGNIYHCNNGGSNLNGGICGECGYVNIRNCYSVGMIQNNSTTLPTNGIGANLYTNAYSDIFSLEGTATSKYYNYSGTILSREYMQSEDFTTAMGNQFQNDFGSNNGFPINKCNEFQTRTLGVTWEGDRTARMEASVYAHNRADRGILYGDASSPENWQGISTIDSAMNYIKADGFIEDVRYGYKAYQIVTTGIVYGNNHYFEFNNRQKNGDEPLIFKGQTFTETGDFNVVIADTTFFLHIDPCVTQEVTLPTITTCYEFTWNGITTNQSTTLRYVTNGANGCDSITYQPVTILDSVVVTLPTIISCHTFTWNGLTADDSTTLSIIDTGSNGCDSITHQPVLIERLSQDIEDHVYINENYNKNGFNLPKHTEIGDYNYEIKTTSIEGCDSIVYLTLHVDSKIQLDINPAKFVGTSNGYLNWQIEGVEAYPDIHIIIYDRFGHKLAEYHGYDNNNGWNGQYKGHLLPVTDYWYWIHEDSTNSTLIGHVTLFY